MSLVIVHLSDTHINLVNNLEMVHKKSQPFFQACSSIITKDDTVILMLTGDVADTGSKDEYKEAERFLNSFHEYINSQHDNVALYIFASPGNHDCDFSKEYSVRQRLMQTIDVSSPTVEKDTIDLVCEPLHYFETFADKLKSRITNNIAQDFEVSIGSKKVGILLINSAWLSTKDEKSGNLCIPSDFLPKLQTNQYDCVISIQHHPLHWLHPDNYNTIQEYYRSTVSLALFGHEHIQDDETSAGSQWQYRKLRGHEFQDRKGGQDGGFAIYSLTNQLAEIITYEFLWDSSSQSFCLENESEPQKLVRQVYEKNRCSKIKKELAHALNDLGIALQHPNKEIVTLDDVYCWPVLELYDIDKSREKVKVRITESIPDYLSEQALTIIEGGSLYGKTALAKMFFKAQAKKDNLCIWFDWKGIKKYDIENIKKCFERTYLEQYDARKSDGFKQLPKQQRTVIIDDFDCIELGEDKRRVLFDALTDFFGCVLLLTSSSMIFPYIWHEQKNRSIVMLRILPLGNVKRNELICKWYKIDGVRHENEESDIERKIANAREIVDRILGDGSGLLPALPINVLGTLQNIENVATLGSEASKFGCIYEGLIRKNFEKIIPNYRELLMEITTHIAYELYKLKRHTISKVSLLNMIDDYKKDYRITLDNSKALDSLCYARVFSFDKLENYRFTYSYFYYYFVGKYVAQNIKKRHVREQIEHMSSHLYVEAYGNIMLFVCHFTNDESVIEEVLLNAYCIYDDVEPFSFNQQKSILERLNSLVENHVKIKSVGCEEDVKKQKHYELERKDGLGINDGTDHDIDESSFEEGDAEKKLTQFFNALKTITVLGQIVYNYPGKITGVMKEKIINETHQLGLRTVQMLMETFGFFEKDLVTSYIEYVREKGKEVLEGEVASRVSTMIMGALAAFTQAILYDIARLLGNELLYEVDQEILTKESSISGKLILFEIELNHLNKQVYQEFIEYYKFLNESRNTFAASILRCSVADYLINNNCGHEVRDKICAALNLDKKAVLHIKS